MDLSKFADSVEALVEYEKKLEAPQVDLPQVDDVSAWLAAEAADKQLQNRVNELVEQRLAELNLA